MREDQSVSSESDPSKPKTTSRKVVLTGVLIIVTSLAGSLLFPDSLQNFKDLVEKVCILTSGFTVMYVLARPKVMGGARDGPQHAPLTPASRREQIDRGSEGNCSSVAELRVNLKGVSLMVSVPPRANFQTPRTRRLPGEERGSIKIIGTSLNACTSP